MCRQSFGLVVRAVMCVLARHWFKRKKHGTLVEKGRVCAHYPLSFKLCSTSPRGFLNYKKLVSVNHQNIF